MRKMTFAAVGLAALLCSGVSRADFIAYDNATTTLPLQGFNGSLGLDFNVTSAITVTSVGVFDNGVTSNLNGVTGTGVTVAIYNRATGTIVPGSQFTVTAASTGLTQINGDAFVTLATPITLAAGFQGSIVTVNDINYNSFNQTTNTTSVENTGSGAVTFVGSGRYGGTTGYPTGIDSGPTNKYDAGTFTFSAATVVVPEPASVLALSTGLVIVFGVARFKKKSA